MHVLLDYGRLLVRLTEYTSDLDFAGKNTLASIRKNFISEVFKLPLLQ